jgi:hypothetical protein
MSDMEQGVSPVFFYIIITFVINCYKKRSENKHNEILVLILKY